MIPIEIMDTSLVLVSYEELLLFVLLGLLLGGMLAALFYYSNKLRMKEKKYVASLDTKELAKYNKCFKK